MFVEPIKERSSQSLVAEASPFTLTVLYFVWVVFLEWWFLRVKKCVGNEMLKWKQVYSYSHHYLL